MVHDPIRPAQPAGRRARGPAGRRGGLRRQAATAATSTTAAAATPRSSTPTTIRRRRGASLSSPNEATAVTHGSLTLGGTAIAYTATAGHLSALDSTPGARGVDLLRRLHGRRRGGGHAARHLLLQRRPGLGHRLAAPGLVRAQAPVHRHPGHDADRAVPVRRQHREPDRHVRPGVRRCGGHRPVAGHRAAHQPELLGRRPGRRRAARLHRSAGSRSTAAPPRRCSSSASPTAPPASRCSRACSRPQASACIGVVELSSIVDYNSNCSVNGGKPTVNCAGFLPSYAAVGDCSTWPRRHDRPGRRPRRRAQLRRLHLRARRRRLARERHAAGGQPHLPRWWPSPAWARAPGSSSSTWTSTPFATNLIANTTLGVYDGRCRRCWARRWTPTTSRPTPSSSPASVRDQAAAAEPRLHEPVHLRDVQQRHQRTGTSRTAAARCPTWCPT